MASALITGTSSGIGFATALALGWAGHTVFATMRNPGRAPALGEQVADEKLPVQILTMDVDSDESVAAAVKSIQEQDGQVDVLVNNAGIERTGSVEELSLDVFRETMETNYFGAIRCIKAVVTEMRERRAGCIVNVTSIAGKLAPAPFAPYSASKFRAGGVKRVPRSRDEAVQCSSRDCRTRNHRHAHGSAHRGAEG